MMMEMNEQKQPSIFDSEEDFKWQFIYCNYRVLVSVHTSSSLLSHAINSFNFIH